MKPIFCTMLLGLTISDVIWANSARVDEFDDIVINQSCNFYESSRGDIPVPTESEIVNMDNEFKQVKRMEIEREGFEAIDSYERTQNLWAYKNYIFPRRSEDNEEFKLSQKKYAGNLSFRQYIKYHFNHLMPYIEEIENSGYGNERQVANKLRDDEFRMSLALARKGYLPAYDNLDFLDKEYGEIDRDLREEYFTFLKNITCGKVKTNDARILQTAHYLIGLSYQPYRQSSRGDDEKYAKEHFERACRLAKRIEDVGIKVKNSGCSQLIGIKNRGY